MKEAHKEDTNKRTGNSSQPNNNEEKTLKPTEVFDSSKYNSMSDMMVVADGQLADKEAVIDLQKKDAIHPEEIGNHSLTTSERINTNPADAKINPMVEEERARTIREVNQEVEPPASPSANQNAQESENVKVIDHERFSSNSNSYHDFPNWMNVAQRQYGDMTNVGLELYYQFVRNTAALTELWWKSFQRLWSGQER
jgi:hypothetical protein